MVLYIFNTTLIPLADDIPYAEVLISRISLDEAKEQIKYCIDNKIPIISAIGHEATAKLLSMLFGIEVQVNRINAQVRPGDMILAFKLKGRLPEGTVISSLEEIEKIGYELFLLSL